MRGCAFPFEEITPPAFSMTKTWDLDRLMGFLNTWSSARRYRERTGLDPVDAIGAELTAAWGEPGREREICWPLHLRVGRVSSRLARLELPFNLGLDLGQGNCLGAGRTFVEKVLEGGAPPQGLGFGIEIVGFREQELSAIGRQQAGQAPASRN